MLGMLTRRSAFGIDDRVLAAALAFGWVSASAGEPTAQLYPNRPIHIFVAEPGAQSDVMRFALTPG